jgi:hypothetical protein
MVLPTSGRMTVHHTFAKSPGVAVILAFFWPGLGHFYAGYFGRGFFVLLCPVVLLLLYVFVAVPAAQRPDKASAAGSLGLIFVGIFILVELWQIVDAYRCAEASNRAGAGGRRRRRYR